MLARCPHCNTIFRISVQQLRIAHGFARCGVCLTPFNAIEHLEDIEDLEDTLSRSAEFKLFDIPTKPAAPSADKPAASSITQTFRAEPAATPLQAPGIPEPVAGGIAANATNPPSVSTKAAVEVKTAPIVSSTESSGTLSAPPKPPAAVDSEDKTQRMEAAAPWPLSSGAAITEIMTETTALSIGGKAQASTPSSGSDSPLPATPLSYREPEFNDVEFATVEFQMPSFSPRESEPIATATPEQVRAVEGSGKIQAEPLSPRFSRANMLWGAGSVFLLLTLATLLAWLHGAEVLERFPVLRPPVQIVCRTLGCEVPIRRQVEAIRLVSRDVRAHPGFQQALLVNAVFVNEAGFRQPYPVLQLELFDTSGTMLAARRFEPTEYLDKDIKIAEGMPAGVPVNIMLELAEPRQFPESFQFHFL